MNPQPPISEPAAPAGFLGSRWALALGSALLAAFAITAGARWMHDSQARGAETVIQLPVPNVSPTPRQELTAPDPGDNP
jgi:hypothetical protein